jgi:hypothetical protein
MQGRRSAAWSIERVRLLAPLYSPRVRVERYLCIAPARLISNTQPHCFRSCLLEHLRMRRNPPRLVERYRESELDLPQLPAKIIP